MHIQAWKSTCVYIINNSYIYCLLFEQMNETHTCLYLHILLRSGCNTCNRLGIPQKFAMYEQWPLDSMEINCQFLPWSQCFTQIWLINAWNFVFLNHKNNEVSKSHPSPVFYLVVIRNLLLVENKHWKALKGLIRLKVWIIVIMKKSTNKTV